MTRVALIDGDMITHRSASSCNPTKKKPFLEEEFIAIARMRDLCERIHREVEADQYRIFIGGAENFRQLLDPSYKANRANIPRPVHLDSCRNVLVREWGAEVCAGYEADDGIGIAAQGDFIIVSNDKDFRQIAGEHYNPVAKYKDENGLFLAVSEHSVVDDATAAFNFFLHMLVGDTSDNIRGVDGIGPIRGRGHLENKSPTEMYSCVRGLYSDDERFLLNYRLLRILRSEEEFRELEAIICESKRQKPTEASGPEDTGNIPGVNQE